MFIFIFSVVDFNCFVYAKFFWLFFTLSSLLWLNAKRNCLYVLKDSKISVLCKVCKMNDVHNSWLFLQDDWNYNRLRTVVKQEEAKVFPFQ